jgi:hypothetical protein
LASIWTRPQGAPKLLVADDLSQVPELQLAAPVARNLPEMKVIREMSHLSARIKQLNTRKTDGFLEALLTHRPDLNGLPMAMGQACRRQGDRRTHFLQAVAAIRSVAGPVNEKEVFFRQREELKELEKLVKEKEVPLNEAAVDVSATPQAPNANIWSQLRKSFEQQDQQLEQMETRTVDSIMEARVSALMQVFGAEKPEVQKDLVKYLRTLQHREATRALARLAIFSPEATIRDAAIAALKVRRERDYTDVLLRGLRYPLPTIAKNTSQAIIKLERKDLLPQLVDVLDSPDPRAPYIHEDHGKKVATVRELVRVNHHRNCLLCHAPGDRAAPGDQDPVGTLTAAMPIQNKTMTPSLSGYQDSPSPDLIVRIDVTYLKQDFSQTQVVQNAAPWPESQRFDFLVRTRSLTDDEAAAFRKHFDRQEAGYVSPYQRAALAALRELTERDVGPTAEAWRKLLNMPRTGS